MVDDELSDPARLGPRSDEASLAFDIALPCHAQEFAACGAPSPKTSATESGGTSSVT